MLFSELAERYLQDKESGRRRVRPNTLEGYRSAIARHVLPAWGDREVASVSYREVQAWVDGFPGGVAADRAFKALRQCVRWAIARREVEMADPTAGVLVPRPPRREPKTLSDAQLNSLLHACAGEPWEAVVWCQATLGLRRCEACALTWGDVNLRSGEVRVDKGRHVVGGEVRVWGTKTARSTRTVVLPRFAVERLRAIRRARRARPDELLCDLRPDAIGRRFRSWCRRNGFEGMSMMLLRHTWATLSVKAGVPIEVVAMALGHTDVTMCYARYLQRSTDVLRAAVRRFGDLVLRAAPPDRIDRPIPS